MDNQTLSEQRDSQGTVSVSLKGIPTDQGHALKEVAKARDINQSALLREMVNASMGSILHVFCIKSSLVASWIRILPSITPVRCCRHGTVSSCPPV
jgi:hypothetical protein